MKESIIALARLHRITVTGNYLEFDINSKNFQITENFKLHEFLTKNNKDTFTKLNIDIIIEVQNLRTAFGSGMGISSSYRSPAYNRSMNGATSSEHIKGNALDTYPINGKIAAWKKVVRENKKTGGRGFYKTFVHIDTGRTRTWNG